MKLILILILLIFSILPVFSQTEVFGLIDGQVWTAENQPYRVTGDLTVLDLTIEPGVQVLFSGQYRMDIIGILKDIPT